MSIKFNISGIDGLEKRLEQFEEAASKGVDGVLSDSAIIINRQQKIRAKKKTGTLAAANVVDAKTYMHKTLGNAKNYAPYQEWGTGGLVSVPAELSDFAIQFKGKGVRQVNMAPHPFFFPPYIEERPKIIKRIIQLFKK